MVQLGYTLSSEEHPPNDLVRFAQMAEQAGFTFASISDHYHPWVDAQGHSPFVWSVLGGIAQATERLEVMTGVTCPTIRIHPAILAQAAATVAAMMPGRFLFGVGTGENLNEHILGDRWPAYDVRAEMLEEAIDVIRLLWEGGTQSFYGLYYTVENARVYTLPEQLPPILVAGAGPSSAELAGRLGDGFVSTAPKQDVVDTFEQAGGSGKPVYGQVHVCYSENEAEARRMAYEIWPTAAVKGELGQELPTPAHFEQAAQMVTEDDVAEQVVCGPDVQKYHQAIQEFVDAGFDHIYIHQIGPDQRGFIEFAKQNILPEFTS